MHVGDAELPLKEVCKQATSVRKGDPFADQA